MDKKHLSEKVVELYESLHSAPMVAKRLDIGTTTVYKILDAAGIERVGRSSAKTQKRKRALHGAEARAAASDYKKGMSMADLKAKYKVGGYAIYTAVDSAGIPRRSHGGQRAKVGKPEAEKMVNLYVKKGLSQEKIAEQLGRGQAVVSRVLRRQGVETRTKDNMSGENHPNWKGGKVVMGDGYIGVSIGEDDPMSPMRHGTGYVLEHRLVMARALGRPLEDHETVHHINGDRKDNRLSNLQLRIGHHGNGRVMRCADCGSYHVIAEELN